ncbi:MAG: DUF4249 family protein [Calditrichaeota bacterium]|nr:MAG: DUF4249 family protein [Calditrichota bacterium]
MKHLKYIILTSLLLTACGTGVVEVDDSNYEPKIAIDGYLYPHAPVANIRVMRNFPLNTSLLRTDIFLTDAKVVLTDVAAGKDYPLAFDFETLAFGYEGTDLLIEYGQPYKLSIAATIDGTELQCSSTTTVPAAGFKILREKSKTAPSTFFPVNDDGSTEKWEYVFQRSPDTGFYALSVVALEADVNTFIYDSPYSRHFDEPEDFEDEEWKNQIYNFTWQQDLQLKTGQTILPLDWYLFAFYGNYRTILYAGDKNFKDFLLTSWQVQEIDGNFHEPVLNIEGDGIGIFGSAIADTVFLEVLRD